MSAAAAFLLDASKSAAGIVVLNMAIERAFLSKANGFTGQARPQPLGLHSAAGYWGVPAAASLDLDVQELFAAAHSFYVATRMKPSMLRNPQIAQARQHPDHQAMVAAHAALVVEVDTEWR